MIRNYLCVVVDCDSKETLASYEIQENTKLKHPECADKLILERSARWHALLKFEKENPELLREIKKSGRRYAIDSVEM